MLQYIRDRATGWIATVIVGLLIIPFALWGVYDYFSPSQNVAVATVNGTELGVGRFNQLFQQQRMRIRRLLGDAYSPDLVDDELLRTQTIERMINDEVLVQAGLDSGLRIGDVQLAASVQTLPVFQSEGGFSQPTYEMFLRNQGLSPAGFEFELRRSMLMEQLANALEGAAIVTEAEVASATRLREQKRRFVEIRIPSARFSDIEPTDAEIEAHFAQNKAGYVSPEQVDVAYVEISRAEIAAGIAVDEAQLRDVYESRKATFATPAQRQASHILLSLPADADEAAGAAVRERIEALAAELAGGASFEDLAREHSEDPGSATQGGDLGWFGPGIMDPAFEKAAFELPEGAVSGPVKSRFGYHLIKVTGARESSVRPFAAVQGTLRDEVRAEQAEGIFVDRVENLANLAFEQPDSLDAAADALDLEIKRTGFITRNGAVNPAPADSPRFVEAAFSSEVLLEQLNSPLIELDDARVMVLRVEEHKASAPLTLDDVRDDVIRALRAKAGAEGAREAGESLVRQLRAGEDVTATLAELEVTPGEEREADRRDVELHPTARELLFRMPRPAEGEIAHDGVEVSGGDYVVIGLVAVDVSATPESAGIDPTLAGRELSAALGQAEFEAVLDTLRGDTEVEIHQGALQ